MNKDKISLILCPECKKDNISLDIFEENDGIVESGIINCKHCELWFRIESGVVDLLPLSLRNYEKYSTFASKYNLSFEKKELIAEKQKQEQIDFFAKDSSFYDEEITDSPYFMALDEITFIDWINKKLKKGFLVLDIGCGTGRQTLPLIKSRNKNVIGIDISEEMLVVARNKAKSDGLLKYADFIACDAENIPLKEKKFHACAMTGALHHVKRPDVVIKSIGKVMVDEGEFFSYDPHDSPVRSIFDLTMKIWNLYSEEASDDPLFKESQMRSYLNDAGLQCKTSLSTYFPPHIFYFLKHNTNVSLLKYSDRLFNMLPFFRKFGGMLIVEGKLSA